MKIFREVVITVAIALAVFFALRLTIQSYEVKLSSMEPNFYQGYLVMVSKVAYRSSGPQRGDVIIFNPPVESDVPYIKRLIGLPGDTVEIKDGTVSINGTPINEPYILQEPPQNNKDYGPRVLSDDEYFVLGDNRNNSSDSRSWGPIKRNDIIGKAWFTYWPPSKWGVVKHYSYPELNEAGEQGIIVSNSIEMQLE
jgi:signal peptidase I